MGGSGIQIFIYFCEFNLKMSLVKLKTLEWEFNDDEILLMFFKVCHFLEFIFLHKDLSR